MHELLLFAPIPASHHEYTLQILAGVTASRPAPLLEHHLVFAPSRPAGPVARAGGAPPLPSDRYYVQLVGHVRSTRIFGEAIDAQREGKDAPEPPWTLEFRDWPDVPGKRQATGRYMVSVPVAEGDPMRFVEALGYSCRSAHVVRGHSFAYGAIDLQLAQAIPLPIEPEAPPRALPAGWESARPLDPAGGYLLTAAVRIADGNQVELMNRGFAELARLKERLKGAIELEMGDRGAMDPRVKER